MSYDPSIDHARYPTLAPLPAGKLFRSGDYISCPSCGGTTYLLRRADRKLLCARCAREMEQSMESVVVPAPQKSILSAHSSSPFFCCVGGKVEAYDYSSANGSVKNCTDRAFLSGLSMQHDMCLVGGWSGITAVAVGGAHTVGLRSDGTVLSVGFNLHGQCNLQSWTNITAIDAGSHHTVGLRSDGTVLAAGHNGNGQCNVRDWTGITAIAVGLTHTVGLRSDGTVLAVGSNPHGEFDVRGWTRITALALTLYHTAGLRSDGTVVVSGRNERGELDDIQNWTDITAITSTLGRIIGLHKDGTLRMSGYIGFLEKQILDWRDIVSIHGFGEHLVAIQSDGTFLCNHPEIEKLLNSRFR